MSAEYQTRKHQIVVKVLDWMYDLTYYKPAMHQL